MQYLSTMGAAKRMTATHIVEAQRLIVQLKSKRE